MVVGTRWVKKSMGLRRVHVTVWRHNVGGFHSDCFFLDHRRRWKSGAWEIKRTGRHREGERERESSCFRKDRRAYLQEILLDFSSGAARSLGIPNKGTQKHLPPSQGWHAINIPPTQVRTTLFRDPGFDPSLLSGTIFLTKLPRQWSISSRTTSYQPKTTLLIFFLLTWQLSGVAWTSKFRKNQKDLPRRKLERRLLEDKDK